jgi:hypothetical protein
MFPTLKIGLKGTRFATMEVKVQCDGRTPEDSRRSLQPVLLTVAGSMEQACMRVSARACLTLKVIG